MVMATKSISGKAYNYHRLWVMTKTNQFWMVNFGIGFGPITVVNHPPSFQV